MKDYLQTYAKEPEETNIIKYNRNLTAVELCLTTLKTNGSDENILTKQWRISFNNTRDVFEKITHWDAVIVAMGTLNQAYISSMFRPASKSLIKSLHSKKYRNVEEFRDKVITNGPQHNMI